MEPLLISAVYVKTHIKLILTCDPALAQWKLSIYLMRYMSRETCNKTMYLLSQAKGRGIE